MAADDTRPLPDLSPVEQRVLGSLLEKQRTVPASYPLTLNALRTACNQTSSREPVTDYSDDELRQCLNGLKQRELVRTVWAGRGSRALKFHQRLQEALDLDEARTAVITVLLLRGAQTPGELKIRTERLHPFAHRSEVEQLLAQLAAATPPLVRELELERGQHDHRWIHQLGPVAAGTTTARSGAPEPADLDAALAPRAAGRERRIADGYDAAAEGYTRELLDELERKPFDRWLLTRVAQIAGELPVADVGCGPGQVSGFLADRGARPTGIDLSPRMIAAARENFPQLPFQVGDLTALLRPDSAPGWGAVTAWYSLVHTPPGELAAALQALTRVIEPAGALALAVHVGHEVRHVDELFGAPVDLDFVLHDADDVLAACTAAGLRDIEWYHRGPLPGEVATERLYVLGRKPALR